METTIMENQMEKKMENEMEYIGVILGYIGVILGLYWDNGKEKTRGQPWPLLEGAFELYKGTDVFNQS